MCSEVYWGEDQLSKVVSRVEWVLRNTREETGGVGMGQMYGLDFIWPATRITEGISSKGVT